jgi:hypothetical protein
MLRGGDPNAGSASSVIADLIQKDVIFRFEVSSDNKELGVINFKYDKINPEVQFSNGNDMFIYVSNKTRMQGQAKPEFRVADPNVRDKEAYRKYAPDVFESIIFNNPLNDIMKLTVDKINLDEYMPILVTAFPTYTTKGRVPWHPNLRGTVDCKQQ